MDNLILANLRHRPTRSLVTGLGIALGTILTLLTVGLARGAMIQRGEREAGVGAEIMVRAGGSFSAGLSSNQPSLPVSYRDTLAGIPGISRLTPIIQYVQPVDSGFGFRIIEAIDFEEYSAISGIIIIAGREAQPGKEEIIIDEEQAQRRKVGPGGEMEIMGHQMKVVGIYSPDTGARIKIPISTMQHLLESPDMCSMFLVKCRTKDEQEAVAQRIREAYPDDQIILMRDLPDLYSNGIPALNVFLRVVIGLAIGISSLVILLAMYTAITERTREIGILKSLGATKVFIVRIIEQEALLISGLGALLGLGISYLARFAIMQSTNLTIAFEPTLIGVAFAIAILGGSLGALYPALRAAYLDPIEALSHE